MISKRFPPKSPFGNSAENKALVCKGWCMSPIIWIINLMQRDLGTRLTCVAFAFKVSLHRSYKMIPWPYNRICCICYWSINCSCEVRSDDWDVQEVKWVEWLPVHSFDIIWPFRSWNKSVSRFHKELWQGFKDTLNCFQRVRSALLKLKVCNRRR